MATCRRATARAFTLIELLLVLAVVAITLEVGMASFHQLLAAKRGESALRSVRTLLAFARQEAIFRGSAVTVCALEDSGRCQRKWTQQQRIAAFIDGNRNRGRDPHEPVLREMRWPMSDGQLNWRASLGRPYIVFENTGGTWQNGTLYYCPESRDARHARALILSHSGRSYLAIDSNGDGLREDRSGKNLRC